MTDMRFVLKDNDGNYVGKYSLSWDNEIQDNVYSFCKYLLNGFYTYQNENDANKDLEALQSKANEIKIGKEFHIEWINRREVINNECKMGVPRYPFQKVYCKELVAIA